MCAVFPTDAVKADFLHFMSAWRTANVEYHAHIDGSFFPQLPLCLRSNSGSATMDDPPLVVFLQKFHQIVSDILDDNEGALVYGTWASLEFASTVASSRRYIFDDGPACAGRGGVFAVVSRLWDSVGRIGLRW